MDAFSSSFLSAIPQTKVVSTTATKSSTSSYFPLPYISAAGVEGRPQSFSATAKPNASPSSTTRFSRSPITSPPPPTTTRPSSPPTSPARDGSSNIASKQTRELTRSRPGRRPTNPPLPSTIFNALDDMINKFIDPPIRPSLDPRFVLCDNFAPVDELPPAECEVVEGSLPPCLNGAYIRNGPNPQYLPRGPYHLFDGDGMLHCILICNGKATLSSRYVRTHKYVVEHQMGAGVVPNVFSGFNGLVPSAARGALTAARVASGQFNPFNGIGLANTSLALVGSRLYALGESDLPYEIRVTPEGDIETLGRRDFDGKLFMSMTAHPKLDLDTGEAFAFRYGPMPPFLTYFRIDKDGNKQPDVPIFSMVRPSFLHDFAITKEYAIFPDIQIGMDPVELARGGSPVGADSSKIPRLGVLPRYARDEKDIRWFEVPGFNLMHAINAWDEVDRSNGHRYIVMVAPNILSIEHALERMDLIHACVEMVRINLDTDTVSRIPLSSRNLDFGVLNPAYVGRKNRYVYTAIGDPMPKISGVVKLDVSIAEGDRRDCTVASRIFGPGCYGGEPFFVARDAEDRNAEEDDGYIVSYVHDENTGESRFIVMDAKSPSLEIVASVRLPQRVPYGFHGLFVRDKDLRGLL